MKSKRTNIGYSIDLCETDAEKKGLQMTDPRSATPSVEELEKDSQIKVVFYKLNGRWFSRAETSSEAGGFNITAVDRSLIDRSLNLIRRKIQGIFRREQVLSDMKQHQPSKEASASVVAANSVK